MGKREPGDSHSMASASSHRSDPGRKPARFFSLRRVIQDMQQQRITSSRKRRSAPADTDPRSSSLAASSTDAGGWHMSRQPVGDMMAGSGIVGALDEESEIGVAHCEDVSENMDCVLCALKQPVSDFMRVTSSCSHRVCKDCLRRYLSIEIMESRINVECPACPERLHPNDVRRILGKNSRELIAKYEEFTLRRLLVHDPDARWCPAPDCGYVVVYGVYSVQGKVVEVERLGEIGSNKI
jgi:Zinc finger, C3HC4 type (RING finger)